jgi:ubiquinone/menaquinone biosynthesis C-methylase UbiE
MNITDEVRSFWEREPCGTSESITGDAEPFSRSWFERVESYRYAMEPFIHSVAQFTRHRGKRVLEIGVGAGTDHLQWARAGAECFGVDLTDAAIDTTKRRLAAYGLSSELQRVDARELPFAGSYFDITYSWGVIHHAEQPEDIVREVHRVLRPGGCFIGMFYGRRSVLAAKMWSKHALLRGRPWRSTADVIWHHMESIGTKSYTQQELRNMFQRFSHVQIIPFITPYDTKSIPQWVARHLPDDWGWFLAIRAIK